MEVDLELKMKNKKITKSVVSLILLSMILLLAFPIVLAQDEINLEDISLSNVGILHWLTHTHSVDIFAYFPKIWQAPSGGTNCLKCNDLRYGCSKYQCLSSGQSCKWINDQLESSICVWDNPNDIKPPVITPDPYYLKYEYFFSNNNAISPPEKGVFLIYQQGDDGCIEPFTNLTLGLYTDEPAICKVDSERQPGYDAMRFSTDQGQFPSYNHTIFLPSSAFPSASALSTINITVDEGSDDNSFYFRCKDTNGNSNTANFLIKFCVETGPDLNPPIVEGTSFPQNPVYVSYNTTQSYFEIYTNEPADCKWDFQELEYEDMTYSMAWCSQHIEDTFDGIQYGCNGTLTGIINEDSTDYYIKCKDQPWENELLRNTNSQPYILTILGAPPLIINEILINDKTNGAIIKDATDTIEVELKVRTSAGADNGNAICHYDLDENSDFVEFINTGTTESTQSLWFAGSSIGIEYNIPIMCKDAATNKVYENATFTVETDMTAPEVVRVYYESGSLKIITDEPAECVYSILPGYCSTPGFDEDDTQMQSSTDALTHYLDWNSEIDMNVKCKDKYGNSPIVNNKYVCSIIVRGSDYTSG